MPNLTKRPSRIMIAAGLVVLVSLSAAATWIASSRIRSPAEVAARTVAPVPSPILVPVETRVISSDIVTRGTGRYGSPQTLTVIPSNLKPHGGYVDTVPLIGDQIDEGDVAMVLSGRPVIVLQGSQPAFRDLAPGMSGSDVLQLEQALERLGFPPGEVDGTYDMVTQFAVSLWYESLGYAPITATPDQQASIRAVETDLSAVDRETLGAAETAAAAHADLLAAREVHRIATVAAAGAHDAVSAARAEVDAANNAAAAELRAVEVAVQQAIVLLPAEWESEEAQQAALFALDELRVGYAAAEAHALVIQAAGETTIRSAELAVEAAPGEVAGAVAAVTAAQARLDLARQGMDLAGSPASQLEHDLSNAVERAGVQVPADEVIFVPEMPVRVAEIHVRRGDQPSGPLLSVTDAIVAIDGSLALDQVRLVRQGMHVTVNEPDLGIDASGTVSVVAGGPGTQGVDGFHVYFETLIDESATPITNIDGASVRLTLAVESSGGPVLAVPASAVTLAVDGTSQVFVDRSGNLEPVTVRPGLAAAGYVAISSDSGDLAAGDLVVIGFEQRAVGND